MKINELEAEIKKIDQKLKRRETTIDKLKNEYLSLEQNIEEAITKESLGDLYNDEKELMKKNIDTIIDTLKTMSDDERLVIGHFLYKKRFISFCSGGFGGYKSPTSCEACHIGERNVSILGLEKYVKFYGDRVYGIPEEIVEQARDRLSEKNIKKKKENLEHRIKTKITVIEKFKKEINVRKELIKIYKQLERSETDYEKVQELMPDFIEEVKNAKRDRVNIAYITVKPEQNIGVILTDEWAYYGSGGSEYGVSVIIFRDGETQSEYFKWRDPYSASKDKPWLYFKEAEIVNITNDGLDLKLKSREGTTTKHYNLKRQEKRSLEERFSIEEQEKFINQLEKIKEDLIEKHYRKNGIMPEHINFWGFKGTVPSGVSTGAMVPYEKPEIVDKFVDKKQGEAILVVKAQIDHDAGFGKQYEWVAYKFSSENIEMLKRECAYQLELKKGKRVDMKASEIYKQIQSKEIK